MPTGNTQQQINYGAQANDGQGDPLRTAFIKTDENFDNIWLAGPVGSNVRITNNTIGVIDTNGNLILSPNGIGVIQTNNHLIPRANRTYDIGAANLQYRTVYANSATLETLSVTGNLTVSGNIINTGNIVTDTLTIQLANTTTTANAANGAGITVGANDNIATLLYRSTSNVWTTNIGLSATGNITAPYFIGNGSQLTGLPAQYGNSNVTTLLASLGANTISGTGNITTTANISGGNILGNGRQLTGIVSSYGNSNVTTLLGNLGSNTISGTGNITTTANISGAYIKGNGSALTSLPAPTVTQDITSNGAMSIMTYDGVIKYVNYATVEPSSGNIAGGNISAIGNIAGNFFLGNGSQLTGISTANTGNVTFDDVNIIGDGNLRLQPDPANASAYLDIFLTGGAGPDIHIAGNGENVIIGRDTGANVAVNVDGKVSIQSDAGTPYTWTFEYDGNLTLPQDGAIYETNIPDGALSGSAIALKPAGGTTANQQLLIYPTANDGDHIHLTSGNLYTTELFLGSDNLYVKLANTGNVVINSNDAVGNSAQWTFDTTGRVVNLEGLTLTAGGQFNICTILTGGSGYGGGGSFSATTGGSGTGLTVAYGYGLSGQVVNASVINPGDGNYQDGDVITMTAGNGAATFRLTQYNVLGNQGNNNFVESNWTFDAAGGTIFPALTVQRGDEQSGTITGQTLLFGNATQEAIISTLDGSNAGGINSQRLVINPGKGEDSNGGEGGDIYLWAGRGGNNNGSGGDVKIRGGQGMGEAGSGGYLRIEAGDSQNLGTPGYIDITGGYGANTYGGYVQVTGGQGGNGQGGPVQLLGGQGATGFKGGDANIIGGSSADGVGSYGNVNIGAGATTWRFDNTGNLTVPGGIVGSGASPAPYLSGFSSVSAITLSASGNVTGNYFIGNGSQLTGIAASYGNANVATFLAAYGSNTISTTGNITAGNLIGNISITSNVVGTQANVTLVAGSYSTVFDNTGNLTLPGNTFAVNYANNTPVNAVTRFESAWTVPVGNSTQSFTVGVNETYQMWVDCNIPNGILVWNATATVTNTNVPVVGYQYAWVYNGGGTPIDFTSIPNQFIGTANAIVRSNTAPSATTNRFDFGINNTSGGNVTVRYGWIAIS